MDADHFARARAAVHADDLETAAGLLALGPDEDTEDLEWQLYFRWVHASGTSSHFGHSAGALELARRALLERRCVGFATYVVATGALQRGELRTALKLFQQASRQEPSLVDARRQQRAIVRELEAAGQRPTGYPLRLAAVAAFVFVVALVVVALL